MAAPKDRSEARIMSGSALDLRLVVVIVNRSGLSFRGTSLSLTQKRAALRREPLLRGEMNYEQVKSDHVTAEHGGSTTIKHCQ